MKLKPEYAERLRQLLYSPDLTLRSRLIVAKRYARHLGAVLEGEISGIFVSQPDRTDAFSFTAARRKKKRSGTRRSARSRAVHREKVLALRQSLADIGKWLCLNDVELTRLNGIEGICDLLEVNPMHRGEVKANASCEDRAIQAVAFDCANESSAASLSGKRPAECKEGPLFSALYELAKRGGVVEA